MNLSDAILKGISISPTQAFEQYTDEASTCVIGAAMIGIGIDAHNDNDPKWQVLKSFPILKEEAIVCPEERCDYHNRACYAEAHTLFGLCIHLNDDHRWTREAIANHIKENYEQCGKDAKKTDGVGSHTSLKV